MSVGREISREEATLVISGWRESGVVIWSQCEVAPLAFSFRGRIVEFSGKTRVRFLGIDGKSEFVFDIKDDFDIVYGDPRDFPEDAKTVVCSLSFFFLPRAEYATNKDFIVLSELL